MATPGQPDPALGVVDGGDARSLGEHNAEILGKVCGPGAEELAKLKADVAFADPRRRPLP